MFASLIDHSMKMTDAEISALNFSELLHKRKLECLLGIAEEIWIMDMPCCKDQTIKDKKNNKKFKKEENRRRWILH